MKLVRSAKQLQLTPAEQDQIQKADLASQCRQHMTVIELATRKSWQVLQT